MRYLLIILLFGCFSVNAQVNFKTGDVSLDAELNIINDNAKVDMKSFRADLKVSFDISDGKLDYMSSKLAMSPGEIYLALEISKIGRIQIDNVLAVYEKDRDKGWGYVAKQLGIQPGSDEFHQLKGNTKAQKQKGKGNGKGNGKAKGKKN